MTPAKSAKSNESKRCIESRRRGRTANPPPERRAVLPSRAERPASDRIDDRGGAGATNGNHGVGALNPGALAQAAGGAGLATTFPGPGSRQRPKGRFRVDARIFRLTAAVFCDSSVTIAAVE